MSSNTHNVEPLTVGVDEQTTSKYGGLDVYYVADGDSLIARFYGSRAKERATAYASREQEIAELKHDLEKIMDSRQAEVDARLAAESERDELREATELARDALEMIRDADEDCRKDGLPTMGGVARAKIDAALIRLPKREGR